MKQLTLTLAALALLTTTPARADETDEVLSRLEDQIREAWYRDRETKAWLLGDAAAQGLKAPPCAESLAQLRNLGAPATRSIELLEDSHDLRAGVHPLPAVRRACDAIERAGKVKELDKWMRLAADRTSVNDKDLYRNCIATYDAVIAAGIPPTERVPERRVRIGNQLEMWAGTIAELKAKYCDRPMAVVEDELARRAAPYRKVLKADKLELALGHDVHKVFTLPGGDASMNPAKLARARVWFDMLTSGIDDVCANRARRVELRRLEFDANHVLVKQSSKEYCGTPPVSALR